MEIAHSSIKELGGIMRAFLQIWMVYIITDSRQPMLTAWTGRPGEGFITPRHELKWSYDQRVSKEGINLNITQIGMDITFWDVISFFVML